MTKILDRCNVGDWTRYFILAAACFATLLTPFLITFNNHTIATCCVVFAIYPLMPLLERGQPARAETMPSPLAFALSGLFTSFTACNELPAAAFGGLLFAALVLKASKQTLLFWLPLALFRWPA